MTVSANATIEQFSGDGTTGPFEPSFKIFSEDDIEVYVGASLQTKTTHYTVSGVGGAEGFSVTFTSGNEPASGADVTIRRVSTFAQDSDYLANGPFQAESHERVLDETVMMVQELARERDRSIRAPAYEDPARDMELPDLSTRKNRSLAFDANGEPKAIDSATGVTVTAFAETVLDDLTAAAMRTTLGLAASDIKSYYESNADTNAFTDALLSKLNGIETSADVTDASNVGTAINQSALGAPPADTDRVPLLDVSAGNALKYAEAGDFKPTDAETKTAYENNADTNAYTDSEKTKVGHLSVTQAVDLDAIETRVNELDASVVLMGTWDASVGTFPGSGSAQAGESWIVSTGGTVDGVEFVANDRLIAIVDNASTSVYANNWHKADYTDQVQSVFGRTGAVTAQAGDYDDSDITAAASATNYTPGSADVDGHLSGIDTGIGNRLAASSNLSDVNSAASSRTNLDVYSTTEVDDAIEVSGRDEQTGASYTLALTNRGQTVVMNRGTAQTLTIPTNASVAFDVGTVINVIQKGAGTVTISGDTGVTVNGVSGGSGDIQTQYQGVSLFKDATDEWIVSGDIGTVS